MSYDPSGGLTGWDLTGFHEGHDTECWKRLGAHEMKITDDERGEIFGTRFSVWAPNAQAVRLVGDFNYWNGENSYMHLVPGGGVWALFVEGASTGNLYKFEVLGSDGIWRLKADPMARFTEAAPHTASIVYETPVRLGRRPVDVVPRPEEAVPGADERLRGAPRVLAEGPDLPGAGERAGRVLLVAGLHARGVPARRPAPVRGLLGLSRHRLLRTDVEVRLTRRVPAPGGQAAPGRHRGDDRLGARALRDRSLGAATVRRHRALRARGSAAGLASGLGLLHLQLRPQRGEELPGLQRLLLAARVPHRRAPGRRGRLHALPRLLPRGRAVGAQQVRRQREPRGHRDAAADERARVRPRARDDDDRRGVDLLRRASPVRSNTAVSASASSGTWAG